MNRISFCVLFSVLCSLLAAATWTGSASTSWSNASNWNPASVPTSSTDVTVPNVTNKPVINAAATCRDMTIQTNSSITISSSYNLTVNGTMAVYGALNMSSTGDLYVTGTTFFESGSTANITNSGAALYLSYNLQFGAGSNVQMTNGTVHIWGSLAATELANYSSLTQIHALNVAKSTGTSFSIRTGGQPFTVNSHISNQAGNTFYNYYTGNITLKGNISDYNTDPAYGIKWDNGTLIMDGTGPSIGVRSTTCYLKNLTFSQSGTAQLTYPLTLKGKLRIESGVFYPQAHNITLAGDWENVVGPAAFTEGTTARVTFNGTSHQLCNYSETFNILEVNSGAALRINGSSAVVTCAQYDWTAGGIDVLAGTFTANDLADSGIFGSYWVNPGGVINLTNNDSWVDLNGSMTFTNGGTINVYGGIGTSDWSYGGNANLTMNGPGILDFKNVGINIYNSGTYTLNCSINDWDAEIRTSGSFTCNRSSFAPEQGWLVMYGSTDATLTMSSGSLYGLRISKTVTREEATTPQSSYITDARTGISREVTRANTVNLATNVACAGSLTIEYGTLNLQSYQISCFRARIYGTLKMNNAAARFTASNQIIWQETGVADISLGTLESQGSWTANSGSNVILPIAVDTYLTGIGSSGIYNGTPTMQFGNLIVGTSGSSGTYTLSLTHDVTVAGTLTIVAGNELDLGTLNLTVNGVLNLNGKLDIHATTATVHGKPYLETTSNLTIDSGSFVCDESTILPRTTYLKGILSINTGTLNLVNHSLYVNAGSTNTMNSGMIYCDGINAQSAGTFQPGGGTFVLGDLFGGGIFGLRVSNGNWLPNVNIDAGSQGYFLYTDLIIKGNLTLLSGSFDVQDSSPAVHNITLGGNWNHQGGTFNPRTGRVIFNGAGHQYVINDETFNIVEVNKASSALRVDDSSAVVYFAQYDWTAGAVDVIHGTLNILDLIDNGLFGNYYCTYPGVLNITNNDGYVDLAGNVTINGGTINVYGGTTDSYWPFSASASLTMNNGILSFKNTGIRIQAPGALSFSYSIDGGTISTTGSLSCYNSGFNPSSGTFKMLGTADVSLDFSAGSLHTLYMAKNSYSVMADPLGEHAPMISDKEGNIREVTRASTVQLLSNLSAYDVRFGHVSEYGGTLWLNGHEIETSEDFSVWNGRVKMDNALDRIVAHGDLYLGGNFFTAEITQGVLETYGNLSVGQGSTVVLPATVSIYLRSPGAAELIWHAANSQLGNLYLEGSGGATHYSLVSYPSVDPILNIAGNLGIAIGNTLTLAEDSSISLAVAGNLVLNGSLMIDRMDVTLQGKPVFAATSNLSITDGSFTFYDSSIPRDTYMRGILNLTNSTLDAVNNALRFEATSTNNITGTSLIYCDGIYATGSGNFQPLGGTVIITENPAHSHYSLNVSNGNWLYNFAIGTDTGVILASNLIIKGFLQIESGNLDVSSSNYSITIGGEWTNLVGESGFTQRNGRVIFNGTASQHCNNSETFHILELNCAEYLIFYNDTAVVTCAQYDWTAGSIHVSAGTFTANDLADNGIYGGVYATGTGTINLTNNDSFVDLNGTMYISDTATVNIYGGTTPSDWAFGGNATINMTGGVLDFKNVGIRIYNSPYYTFTSNIGGGVIRTVGGFEVHRSGFEPWGGTLELYGSTDASLIMNLGNLYNLNINKAVSRDEDNLSQESLMAMEKDGSIRELTRSNSVNLGSNLVLTNPGSLTIESGNLYSAGWDISCNGNFSVNSSTAAAYIEAGSILRMGGVRNLSVNAGLLNLTGSAAERVIITSISGFYNFNVESGANLSAIYTTFEKMTANGVNVKNGALVNTTDPFKNCTFQNGAAGGTLLTLNSNQTLNIDNAVFPTNTWSGTNNVKKAMNWGTVNFNLATGAFSGAAFESDAYNRINWLGGNPDLRITSIDWSSNNPYICDAVTATVHVQNNSTTNITTPFRVDLYKNRTTTPPSGTLGDSYIAITSLAAGVTTNVTFTNISTDVAGVWTSWFQVDASNQVTETNESNNVWTPAITTTWHALPIVTNLEAERSGSDVQLNWTYPISVYRFKIYQDTNPNGSFSTLAGTSATPSFSQAFSGTKWFYRVRAERLLP